MIGNNLGRYRILDLLGKGGMGEVYLALDQRLQRKVAIKILPSDCLPEERDRKKFKNEALAISRLNHQNVATIYDFDTIDGVDALIMEYVPGETLHDTISHGPLPIDRCAEMGTQIARGLEAAHKRGVVHRDLKPKNVRATSDGDIKILDFGIARLLKSTTLCTTGESLETTESTSGTPSYMSPEQINGQEIGPSSDLFSLGLVLYEMVTGRHAFEAEYQTAVMYRIVHDEPVAPSRIRQGVPQGLEALILRLLSKSPEERPRSAGEVAQELESFGSSTVLPSKKSHKSTFIWSSIWVAGVLLLGFLLAYIFRPGEVYSSRAKQGTIRQLTFDGNSDIPTWSPDGKYIAFYRAGDVHVIPAEGGAARKLESSCPHVVPWGWTNDSNGVLGQGYGDGKPLRVVRLDLLNAQDQVLIEKATFPALSPDGRELAFMNLIDRSVSILDIASGRVDQLVAPESDEISVYKPHWLPDGSAITYIRWAGGPGHELWIINRDGTGKRQVSSNGIWLAGQYTITPDGRGALIAGELGGVWYIWRISLNGQDHERLTEGAEHDCHVGMSPDGRKFVFGRSADVSRIALLDVETGTTTYPVEMSVSNRHPSFTPDGNSIIFQALVNGRWQIWRALLDENGRSEPVLAQDETSFSAPSINGNEIYHIRSQVGQVHIWGPIKWSQSLWKTASDGGRQKQLSPDGEMVERISSSPGPTGHVLYTCQSPKNILYEKLILKSGDAEPITVYEDSEKESFYFFDWGPDEDSILLVVGPGNSLDSACTLISMNLRSGARSNFFTTDQLCRDLGMEKKIKIASIALAPDRRQLALLLNVRDSSGAFSVRLVIRNLHTGEERHIYSPAVKESIGHFSWSPDSKHLAMEINRQKSDLFLWEPIEDK